MMTPTLNSSAFALSTYHRFPQENPSKLETWDHVVARVLERQRWLWERALKRPLNEKENLELHELKDLIERRAILPDGRTLWLSGTELSQQRESCMFNSAFTYIETVYDVVDLFWLLLQGCSLGFYPVVGMLNGFSRPLESVEIIRSTRTTSDGAKYNEESFDPHTGHWTIKIGDTAEAFAKAVGKLIAGKYPAKKLILDFSEIRPQGSLLKGYGWVSTGDEPLAKALENIAKILSRRSDQLLQKGDILELIRHLNHVPASKQTAELALIDYGQSDWEALCKIENSALLFQTRPSKEELTDIFHIIMEGGGRAPGLMNGNEASRRAPWFKGCNPSTETLLGNKSFCTFVEVNLLAFQGDKVSLERALFLAARMNYRQTLVHLKDEILQEAWHLNNEFLHLCGVSLTGVRGRGDLTAYDFRRMRNITVSSAFGMAQELNTPLPKNVTCIKPSKTLTKIMGTVEWGDVPEGISLPRGKYLFNYLSLAKQNPAVEQLKLGGYQVLDKPYDPQSVLVKCPSYYGSLPFLRAQVIRNNEKLEELEINAESAVTQLDWYLKLQETWSEQNVSTTIFYDPSEVPDIVEWLFENWNSYVGVSFAFRQDPLKNANELGLPYLEQEVVSEEMFKRYVSKINLGTNCK